VPAGGLLVGTTIGFRWAFGARRHELVFAMRGSRDIRWVSRPGDFKYKQNSVDKVLAFARSRGLLAKPRR
jgi:hypothetical protein